jgi:hypothetical protein
MGVQYQLFTMTAMTKVATLKGAIQLMEALSLRGAQPPPGS